MKEYKFGKKKFNIIETMFDINDKRFHEFKKYFVQVIEKMDVPAFSETFAKYKNHFDNGRHADGFIEWYNFKKATQLKELDYDAYSFCFALLCLYPDENQQDISEDYQHKKLDYLRANGLSRGFVEETVINFMKASPKVFGVFLQMLEILGAPLPEGSLSE